MDTMSKTSNKKAGKDKANGGGTIALNKRARHDYHLEERFEAGVALQGWELKAIRAGRANIVEAYAMILKDELYLIGAQMTPLISASTHVVADAHRTRKLLLHRREIERLLEASAEKGLTIVPIRIYFNGPRAKVELALAKGKDMYDKRRSIKDRDVKREIDRAMSERY
jgi:SsrA-binding protein